ncbi:MAG TPA: ABC transporter substrate-binding protein, partial [Pyrinomonadaceae bacterium]|nr:ABC transporter substrate-binding protein [Pyrinomonadaceae bacterium]
MTKKILVWLLVVFFVANVSVVTAQQPTKVPHIGHLTPVTRSAMTARYEAFRQGLRELNYVEGKNIVVDWRSGDGQLDRMPALATDLVRMKVDIIITAGPTATRAAKAATSTIPIVMAQDPDPIGNGFIASLARPGGNITGLSTLAPELGGKRLEILREVVPKLSHVAVLGTSTDPGTAEVIGELEHAAKVFGIKLQYVDVLDSKDVETAFRLAKKGRADGVLVLTSPVFTSRQTNLAELAVKNRLAVMYSDSRYVEAGGLMTYGVNFLDLDRRAATFVDKILKGRKPA